MYEVKCVMKTTPHEIKYREENFHDLSSIKEDDIQCSACGEKLIAKTGRCYVNRVVGTLQCQTCYHRYEEKKPWESTNCLDFCIMCGKSSGQIQKCCKKDCTFSSCQACILRNISETSTETNKRKWSCFICSSKLLYPRRAVAATVMASLSEKSCDQPIKKMATNVNVNKTSALNKKRDRRRPYKKIITYSSDSDVSSDMSEENVFKKKPATQRPSTSGTPLSGFGMKTKTSRVNLTCNNDDTLDEYHNKRSGRNNTQLSSQCSTNKRETNNNSAQLLKARKLNDSKRKSTKQLNGNSNINNNNYDIKKSVQSLARQSSHSSSEKEFSIHKIIPSYVPLQRIADIEKDYTTSPTTQSSPNDTIRKQDAFILKNNIHKFLHDMKKSVKVLQNHIEHIEKNYHYKENLTANDATHMMVECTSMIRDLKQHVDNSKEKVIHSYDTWCKKAKIKNVFSCKKSPVATTDTPDRGKEDNEKSVVIDSSNSDSDTTIINFPVNRIKNTMKNTIEKKVAETVGENQHSESSTDISDFDKTEIFSGHEPSNPPSPVTTNSIRIDERHIGTKEKTKLVGVLEENITKDVENNKKSDLHKKFKRISERSPQTNKQSNNVLLEEVAEDPLKNTQSNDEFLEEVAEDPLMNNQSDDELMMEVAENILPITIIDSTNNKSTNISKKSSAHSITPQLKLHSNMNCHDSSHSSVDMFQDESEHENDVENFSDDILIKSHAKSSTPQQIPSSKNTTLTKNDIDDEEEKSRKAMLLDSSSSDTEIETPVPSKKKRPIVILSDGEIITDKISSQKVHSASKSSRNSQSERRKESPATTVEKNTAEKKEESGDKLPKRRLSKSKRKSINSSTESLVNENILVDSAKMDEERAKNALLDSSSDSDREVVFDTSNEQNNSLSGGDELSDSEDLVNKTNEQKNPKPTSLGGSNSNNSDNDNNNCSSNNNNNHNASVLKSKRDKFILCNNTHYKSDPKLRKVLAVGLTRLGKNILEQHSNALKLSREYLENKQVKSLVSIENIEKKKKKMHASDLSSSSDLEDGESSMKRPAKSKKKMDSEETLLDHLNKATENNGESDNNDGEDDEDRNSDSINDKSSKEKFENDKDSTECLTSDADKLYKAALLESSNSEAEDDEPSDSEKNNMAVDDPEKSDTENVDKADNNKNDSQENTTERNELDKSGDLSSDEESISEKNDKGRWKHSKILTVKFSDTDSEEEKRKIEKKKTVKKETSKMSDESDEKDEECEIITDSSPVKKKRTRRRRLASDSDIKITDDSDNSSTDASDRKKKDKGNKLDNDKKEDGKRSRKRRKKSDNSSDSSSSLEVIKSKPKRKRIRAVADDSDSDSGNELNGSQGRSGRKNIRKVLKDKQVADDTKQAGKLEEERLRRMAERQKLYNEMYEARLANEEKVDKLVLDFDEESKEVLLSVDENLVKRLKPHQARGIKFMWDAAYESLERAKTTSGSGCILAHCMGLGKSFQVVTLSHTLISNSEKTGVNTILIVAPLSTVLNWVNEFKIWLSEVENGDDIEIYEMTKCKTTYERKYQLESWMRTGGILIIGYEMFRNLTNATKKVKKNVRESILKCLIDPGADLVICDEGHLLKNEDSAISKAMRRIRTLRRIVLTGTPLQNNLIEYHCMVQFVKPNLLGTKREFSNRFVNPIQNGQFDDSTEYDVKVMKKRAHVLHKMLEGSVQRFDYSVLMPFLPPKQEYVILARLTEVQVKLYQYYLDKLARQHVRVGSTLFPDFQALQRIWTHPSVVKSHTEKMIEKRRDAETDSEGSLKDFIDDGSDSDSSSVASSNHNSDVVNLDSSGEEKKINKRGTRANPVNEPEPEVETENKGEWWTEFVEPHHLDDMRVSAKLLLLFDIIKESEAIGDKVLVFSQSLYSLTLIEKFLGMIDDETQKGNELDSLDGHTGSWSPGLDYFRFDGQTSADNRSHWVKLFNKPSNTRARLFLISTRAGGLGINLTAANRVVIFDASWNPSHDVQSIFRIYRFGQKKPCYVYRLLAAGTMEEKIYNRQVTKLSLSCRVVDEQQIERHFSNNDLAELYKFDPPSSEPSQLALPKDRLIAEIFLKHKNLVETYHEHDSLLENIAAEELDDEERKQAWLEYEQEKAGNRPMSTQMISNYQQQQQMLMMQQFNNQMMNMNEMNVQGELQSLLQFISKDYPHLTEAAQRDMAFRTLSNMYSYVENQVTTNLNNPANIPNFNNPTATLANALAQQEYARQHATVNKYQQQQQQQQQQLQYAQKFGNNVGGVVAPAVRTVGATSRDDDIVEIAPSSSRTNSTLPASSSTKSQEE